MGRSTGMQSIGLWNILFVSSMLAIPFAVFYWMVPYLAGLTLGNDYPKFPIFHQMELQFSWVHGSFPLYVPGHGGGNPSSTLTLGQIYHPISHLAAQMPRYWTGKALDANTLIRLFSLGLTHLALFYFLRRLAVGGVISFTLSFIAIYNLRMLDLFRYGASLENYTGFLLLCVAIGWYYLSPSGIWGPLSIVGSTYLLVTGGHPQMMYYGFIGAGLITLVFPFYLPILLPEIQRTFLQNLAFWARVFGLASLGVLLSSAYTLPFYFDFLLENPRAVQSYSWASGYLDTTGGTLNNFFKPLSSDVHGAFGGSSLFLLAALTPLLRLLSIRIPIIIWILWSLSTLCFLHMQGPRLGIHFWVWNYLPLASSFRIPGRISMIMPLLLVLILVWILKKDEVQIKFLRKTYSVYPYRILCILALGNFLLYHSLFGDLLNQVARFAAVRINVIPEWVNPLVMTLSLASLITLFIFDRNAPSKRFAGGILCLALFLQAIVLMRYGTWVENKKDTVTLSQMRAEKQVGLTYYRPLGLGLYSKSVQEYVKSLYPYPVDQILMHVFQQMPLAKIYREYASVPSRRQSYEILRARKAGSMDWTQPLLVERFSEPQDAKKLQQKRGKGSDRIRLNYSSFNRIEFEVFMDESGFFVTSYPFSHHWKAWVNSHETEIYPANGIQQAIWLSPGSHSVEFRFYSKAAFWGMIISSVMLAMIGVYLSLQGHSHGMNGLGIVLSLLLGIGIFWGWYESLYSGKHLETEYQWSSLEPTGGKD